MERALLPAAFDLDSAPPRAEAVRVEARVPHLCRVPCGKGGDFIFLATAATETNNPKETQEKTHAYFRRARRTTFRKISQASRHFSYLDRPFRLPG